MKERNDSIDILKLILILFVVFAHIIPYKFNYNYQTNIAYIIHGLARTVVPLFFIISGYYIKNKLYDLEKIKTSILKYCRLFLIWQLIYFPLLYFFYKNNLYSFKELSLNLLYGFGHLWFLSALIGGLILVYLVKNNSFQYKVIISIILLFSGYILQLLFELKLLNKELTNIFNIIGTSRNFLFFGFPYLLLGTIIDDFKLSNIKLGFYVSLICIIGESFIYKEYKISVLNLFISAIPLSIYTFKYTLKAKNKLNFKTNPKLLLGIYLIHFYPVFYTIIYYPSSNFGDIICKIIIVLSTTFVLFYLLNIIDKKIKILF